MTEPGHSCGPFSQFRFARSAQTLSIRDSSESEVFWEGVKRFQSSIEESGFAPQRRMAFCRQAVRQVNNHGAEPARDLNVVRATEPNFGKGELDKVIPARGAEDHPEIARAVVQVIGSEIAPPGTSEKTMELVHREDSRGRVVNGGGESFDGDVHQDPKGKEWILLHRAL